jgi:hypothetical protein
MGRDPRGGLAKHVPIGVGRGDRNTDTRTDDQRYRSEAKKTVEDLQGLTGGGKPPPKGWDGGLKSDSARSSRRDTP